MYSHSINCSGGNQTRLFLSSYSFMQKVEEPEEEVITCYCYSIY